MIHFFRISKTIFMSFLLLSTTFADEPDEAYINLIERLDAIERRMGGQTPSGADTASQTDVDSLNTQIKELRGRIEELEHHLSLASREGTVSLPPVQGLGHAAHDATPDDNEKNDISISDDALDDLIDNLDVEPTSQSEKIEESRNRATQNAEKNAPTSTLERGDATAQYNQAMALYNKQSYGQAADAFRYYLEQHKTGKMAGAAKLKIARCQLELAKKDKAEAKKAVKEYATLYKANPKGNAGAEALLGLGEAVTISGDSKKACLVLKKARADFPKIKEVTTQATALMKRNKCA